MLGLGKTRGVRASATASSARSRDVYQRYAVALYRQALLTLDDSPPAEHIAGDAVANEYARAPGRGAARTTHVVAWLSRCSYAVTGWWPARRRGIAARAIRRPRVHSG